MTTPSMLLKALTDDSDKIYCCRNPHTLRWITLQRGNAIADAKYPKDALAVARAEAQKLPKAREKNGTENVVVEAVGHRRESPSRPSGPGMEGLRRSAAQ